MNKLFNLLKSISGDKWAHFLVCLLIVTSVGFWLLLMGHFSLLVSTILGGFTALSFGVVKELSDSHKEGNYFSWGDFLADSIGTISGMVLVLIFG